jgi:Cu+-exporting ATPase
MKKFIILLFVLFFFNLLVMVGSGTNLYSQPKEEGTCKMRVVKCPVSGEVIGKDAQTISTEYKGNTYYFCCENCKAEFEKNPEKYIKVSTCKTHYYCPQNGCQFKSDNPGKCPKCGVELKKHECKTIYACTMKDCEYKSDNPGKCPKCGMELKKMECKCHSEKKCDSSKEETKKEN